MTGSATNPAYVRFLHAIQSGLAAIHPGHPAPDGREAEVSGRGALDSAFAVTDLAVASIGAAAFALVAYIEQCTGRSPAVRLDRRLASLWFDRSLQPIGWQMPAVRDSVTGDYQGRDGWIRIHANAPHHRRHAVEVLGVPEDQGAVAQAVAAHRVQDLEDAMVAAGACAAIMRSPAQWSDHPPGPGAERCAFMCDRER